MSKLAKFGSSLLDGIDKINSVMHWSALVFIIGMAAVICFEVFMRYVLGKPTMFTCELTQIMQVLLATLAAGWVLREEGHVIVELVVDRFSSKRQGYIYSVTSILGAIFCGLVVWLIFLLFLSSFKARLGTAIMGWPLYPVRLAAAIGIALLCLQFIARSYKYYRVPKGISRGPEVSGG